MLRSFPVRCSPIATIPFPPFGWSPAGRNYAPMFIEHRQPYLKKQPFARLRRARDEDGLLRHVIAREGLKTIALRGREPVGAVQQVDHGEEAGERRPDAEIREPVAAVHEKQQAEPDEDEDGHGPSVSGDAAVEGTLERTAFKGDVPGRL